MKAKTPARKKGLHLRLNDNEMTFSLFDDETKVASIFEHEFCFDDGYCRMWDIKDIEKAVRLIKQAEKKTDSIMRKLFPHEYTE